MSGGATASAPPPQPPAFKRAVKKIKCAAMVASLAKSWQGWAQEHADKQDTIPSGWMPSSVTEADDKEHHRALKVAAVPRVVAADPGDSGKIRTGSVTKSVRPKRSECGGAAVVNAIRDKMQAAPESTKPFLGNESPTRRRHMRALQSGGAGGGVIQDRKNMLKEKKSESRCSSVDTEDSGIGDDDANGELKAEPNEEVPANKSSRPKIKIASMDDIKSRWQRWSDRHVEGQKLNPFSDDFDYDYAMSRRLRKGDDGYGRPEDGSKTAQRGDRAQKHIRKEMEEMVWIIRDMGVADRHGRVAVSFGRLFDRYVKISDKVVGILLRCRKHKMVDFEGEMLWQGRDDDVIITLRD